MVHFVGAGPGAPDLITLRGAELLRSADVIIYAGSLVNPALLKMAGEDCEIYNSAEMTLEDVLEVMERAEREKKKNTVRLHTGDPCLYGALGAEYTLPDVSQSVIITRMAGRTPVPEGENLASLASHGASLVLFLSAGMLDKVQEELLRGGAYTAETLAALVYKATWPEEKVVRCTVGTLARTAQEAGIRKTALVLVGDFLGDAYSRSKLYDPAFTTEFREGRP